MKKKLFSTIGITSIVALALCTVACTPNKNSNGEQSTGQEQFSSEVSSENANPDATTTLTGVAVGGAHASIALQDAQGVEHEFSFPDLGASQADTWEEGDTMVVTYVHNPDPEIGDSVVSLRQKNPKKSEAYSRTD